MIDPKENYLINTEMSVEDNYNSIDGIINNTTAQDKNGEKVSKYLDAIKAEEEKKEENTRFPFSAKKIKNSAAIISSNSSQRSSCCNEEKIL